MANNYDKYQKLKLQYTYGPGDAWVDVEPPRYKAGELIEKNSPDCGGTNPLYRWYALPNDYICQGYNKYYKEVYQVSMNEGLTWENVEPYQERVGELIETNSIDCDYGIEWKLIQDEYICEMMGDGCFILYRTVPYDSSIYDENELYFRYRRNDIWYNDIKVPFSTDLATINLNSCEPINEFSFGHDAAIYLDLSHANMVMEKNKNNNHISFDTLNVEEINVSNVKFNLETTKYTLSNCFGGKSLKTIIGMETWDLSKVQSMAALIYNKEVLESDIIFNDTAKVLTNINGICQYCKKIKNFKLPLYNLESGIYLSMGGAFDNCSSLANIFFDGAELLKNKKINNLSTTFYKTQITNFTFENCEINGSMTSSFSDCTELQTVIFNNCTITNTNLIGLFGRCINLTDVQFNNCTIDANKSDLNGVFEGCKKIKKIDLSMVTNLFSGNIGVNMFYGCEQLEEIDFGNSNNEINRFYQNMFYGCNNLKTIKGSKNLIVSMINHADIIALPEAFRDVNYSGWIINT